MKTFKTFLTEARGRIYARIPRSGEFLAVGKLYTTPYYHGDFPGYVVDIRDKNAVKVPVYIIKPSLLKKKTQEAGRYSPDYGEFGYLGNAALLDNYSVPDGYFDQLETLITKYGAGKKIVMDRNKLAQELVLKANVPEVTVKAALGDVNMSAAEGSYVGTTKVHFTSGISPRKQKSVLAGIEAAKAFTKPFPKVHAWFENTEFFVVDKKFPAPMHKAAGYYAPYDDRIVISTASIKSEMTFVSTILHELIHRIDYKGNLDKSSYTAKHRNLPMRPDIARNMEDTILNFILGVAEKAEKTKIVVNGRVYYVLGKSSTSKNVVVFDVKTEQRMLMPPRVIADYNIDVELDVDGHPWEDFPEDVKTMMKMFPSGYSAKGVAEEWFAEIGAASMMHKIDGDIADWFKEEIETASEPPQSPQDGS